jgi:hypothetical protein
MWPCIKLQVKSLVMRKHDHIIHQLMSSCSGSSCVEGNVSELSSSFDASVTVLACVIFSSMLIVHKKEPVT